VPERCGYAVLKATAVFACCNMAAKKLMHVANWHVANWLARHVCTAPQQRDVSWSTFQRLFEKTRGIAQKFVLAARLCWLLLRHTGQLHGNRAGRGTQRCGETGFAEREGPEGGNVCGCGTYMPPATGLHLETYNASATHKSISELQGIDMACITHRFSNWYQEQRIS